MKNIFIILLVLFTVTIYGVTLNVDPNDPGNFNTIQGTIDEALSGTYTGDVEILVSDSSVPYNENLVIDLSTNIGITDLKLQSINGYDDCEISYNNDIPVKVIGNVANLIIEEFEISSINNTYSGVKLENASNRNPVQINSCLIINNLDGIQCVNSNVNISNSIVSHNGTGISFQNLNVIESTYVNYTEISNNDVGLSGFCSDSVCLIFINNCSIVDNTIDGIDIEGFNKINSTIVRPGSIDSDNAGVSYSNIVKSDGTIEPGIGNFNQIPRFTDSTNEDFTLMYDSSCIDSGDPDASLDADGTRKDVGCYPVDQDLITDTRTLRTGWNWLCFPRLKRVDYVNNNINLPTFGTGKFIGSLWDDTVTGFNPIEIKGNFGNNTFVNPTWNDPQFLLESIEGFKLNMSGTGSESQVGALESPDTEIQLTNLDTRSSYIGYILADAGLITEVVPLEMLQYKFQIQTQHWCATYDPFNLNGNLWTFDTTSEPVIKCGQMIALKMRDALNGTFTFQWREPQTTRVEYVERPMPEYFSFVEQENYLPVFLELDCNNLPQEIALYIDGECKGAAVVNQNQAEEAICQINAYLLEETENNWQEELDIVYYYGSRNSTKSFNEFAVYNQHNSEYYNQNLILADMIDQDQITISMRDGNYEEAPETEFNFRSHNYPNPFNPTTDIYFSLPATADTSLEIYNVKGQKVRTLVNGKLEQGEHQITWDGTDSNHNSVSSGTYFYHLQSGENVINKKMMLMK